MKTLHSKFNWYVDIVNMKVSFYVLLIALSLLFGSAYASPTSYDFKKCEQLGVAYLNKCFKSSSYNEYKSCWDKSKNTHMHCYRNIFKKYSSDSAQRTARKKAEKEKQLKERNRKREDETR